MNTKILTLACLMAAFHCVAPARAQPSPRLYRTTADIARARGQIKQYPALAASYENMVVSAKESMRRWRKQYPESARHTTSEWLALGGKVSRPPIPDLLRNATRHAITPDKALGKCIREQMLLCIGSRIARGTWRELGIHEGQRMMEFLKAYDLISGADILSPEEHRIIRDEICRSGYFFEGWLMDNPATRIGRDEAYCLNIQMYPTAMLGIIAAYNPDFPESKRWLASAQEQMVKYLLTDFALDGGYGEGSAHYFQPAMEAMLEFMNVCKNTGAYDYSKDAAVSAAIKRALTWRMDLMGGDARIAAVGDARRTWNGGNEFELAARLFNDPGLAWPGRWAMEVSQQASASDAGSALLNPLVADFSIEPRAPVHLYANYPWSGYAFFRSGWSGADNFLMFKYGPTWIGRREVETHAVIGGHAHEDALQIELHWKGIPLLVDPGIIDSYAEYLYYGGYWKGTISHNTVGLGNPYGHDRLDGKYDEHVRKHGREFLYEQGQLMIGRADYKIRSIGDVGGAGFASVTANTFPNTTHTRSVLWLRDSSLAIVFDRLESDQPQPYEWYLNPVGRLLEKGDSPVFGGKNAKLKIIPILPDGVKTQILQTGDANIPAYYRPLRPEYEPKDLQPWGKTSLVIESIKARQADFINILVPHGETCAYEERKLGANGRVLASGVETIMVARAKNDDPALIADEGIGFARKLRGNIATYALYQGHSLAMEGGPLVSGKLKSKVWESRYTVIIDALVSLPDKRASIGLPLTPMQLGLVLERINPTDNPGVTDVEVELAFRVDEKPRRMFLKKSALEMPVLGRALPNLGRVSQTLLRTLRDSEPSFTYDESTRMVTVTLPPGISQLVWE
jgi:hypothetical protein